MLALSDVELVLIGKAFDRAWDNYLRAGLVTPENLLDSRRLLAARILRCHRYGERDAWRLARDAVGYVRELGRFGRSSIALSAPKTRTASAQNKRGANRPRAQTFDVTMPIAEFEETA
jgi:hypothetical protein